MVFVKQTKNSAYYKRFQVKFRRRRAGKTDYEARRYLTFQQKNKYNTPKHRFVVRFTNTNISCQVISATLTGDRILCQAQSRELKRFGLTVGLTNYSAAYATGLLLSRRLLTQIGLDKTYEGVTPTGEAFDVYKDLESRQLNGEEINRRPFKAQLDVGLVKTTTGNRVFGALKGACDGGMHIPHSTRRFPGSHKDESGWAYDAEAHRNRIFGQHVQEYMTTLKDTDPEKYKRQFSKWDAALGGKSIESLYKGVFEAVRKDSSFKKQERAHLPVRIREGQSVKTSKGSYPRPHKSTREERKQRVMHKIVSSMPS